MDTDSQIADDSQSTSDPLSVKRPRRDMKPPLKHGAYMRRSPSALMIRGARVRRLVSQMRLTMPWLEDSDLPACRAWAELEIVGSALFAAMMEVGAVGDDGQGSVAARRLVNDHRQNRLAKLAIERELGMTPLSRMQLRINSGRAALDIAAIMAQAAAEDAELAEDKPPADDSQSSAHKKP